MKNIYIESLILGLALTTACTSTPNFTRRDVGNKCPSLISSEGYFTYWHCIKNCAGSQMASFGVGGLEGTGGVKYVEIAGYQSLDPAIPQKPVYLYFKNGGVTAHDLTLNDIFGPSGFETTVYDDQDRPQTLTYSCHELKIGKVVYGYTGAHDFLNDIASNW